MTLYSQISTFDAQNEFITRYSRQQNRAIIRENKLLCLNVTRCELIELAIRVLVLISKE